ncbi:MAG: epimerase [Glaciihabitans sp.]|nr:epimerase [Glaciihabitans sp.]
MIIAGLVVAGIAALIHVYIFFLESIAWTGAKARATFGTSEEEAHTTRALAFNQGFYNLFLTVIVVVGIVLYGAVDEAIGATLVFAGAGSMVAAGLVLLLSSPSKARSALIQLAPALVGVALLATGLAIR